MTAPYIQELTFVHGRMLRDREMFDDAVTVRAGIISDSESHAVCDLTGYDILPGIIDLHGDAFERHIAPRPTAPFPIEMGLVGTDRDAAAQGVTTAWMAQSWSWEGAGRGPDFAEQFMVAHQRYKQQMLTDLRIQIRCETHTVDTEARLIAALRAYDIDYVVFNNHLDEAVEIAKTHPARIADWASRANRTAEEHMAVVNATRDLADQVPRYLCNLASVFDALGVRYGSHDDQDARTREYYAMIGAKICEFPTQAGAAAAAKASGDPVIMGAPNVVRGGSQAGNISATMLIRDGLCDVLVSDYHYPTLSHAALALVDQDMMDLPQAWSMISSNAAKVMGLTDRGVLQPGKRADLVIMNRETRQIEATMAGGRWSYLSGGIAHRLTSAAPRLRVAAE